MTTERILQRVQQLHDFRETLKGNPSPQPMLSIKLIVAEVLFLLGKEEKDRDIQLEIGNIYREVLKDIAKFSQETAKLKDENVFRTVLPIIPEIKWPIRPEPDPAPWLFSERYAEQIRAFAFLEVVDHLTPEQKPRARKVAEAAGIYKGLRFVDGIPVNKFDPTAPYVLKDKIQKQAKKTLEFAP